MSNEAIHFIELRQKRDFSAVISTGFQFIRQNWKTLYRPLIFISLPIYVVAALLFGTFFRTVLGNVQGGNVGDLATGMGSMFLGYLLMITSMLILYALIFEYMRFYWMNKGQAPRLAELWKQTSKQLPAYFVIGLLAALIAGSGLILFIIPGIWLLVVFSMALPLRAFERTSIGDSIGHSFRVIKGNWWATFGLLLVLSMLIGMLSYVIYLPIMLVMGFGAMSGMSDPQAIGSNMGWMMTVIMLLAGVMNVLLQPLLLVPLGLHTLSLIEEKEGRGLLQQVDDLRFDPQA